MIIKSDFHNHTLFSDGKLAPTELLKLYKSQEILAFAITDHYMDMLSAMDKLIHEKKVNSMIKKEDVKKYVDCLWKLHSKYSDEICLIPGYELTNNVKKFHLVVLNVDNYNILDPSKDLIENLEIAKENNFITIAAHPCMREKDDVWQSKYLWKNRKKLKKYIDLWEVGNGDHIYNDVAKEGFNLIANSDFHNIDRLFSWRTKLEVDSLKIDDVLDSILKEKNKSFYFHKPI